MADDETISYYRQLNQVIESNVLDYRQLVESTVVLDWIARYVRTVRN